MLYISLSLVGMEYDVHTDDDILVLWFYTLYHHIIPLISQILACMHFGDYTATQPCFNFNIKYEVGTLSVDSAV